MRVTVVPSDLLCKGPQEFLTLGKPAQPHRLPQVSLVFAPQVFMFTEARYLSSSCHFPIPSLLEPESHTSTLLWPLLLHDCKMTPRAPWLTAITMHMLRARSSSYAPAHLQPDSHHQPPLQYMHKRQEPTARSSH